jgi:hypothetical protein
MLLFTSIEKSESGFGAFAPLQPFYGLNKVDFFLEILRNSS